MNEMMEQPGHDSNTEQAQRESGDPELNRAAARLPFYICACLFGLWISYLAWLAFRVMAQ